MARTNLVIFNVFGEKEYQMPFEDSNYDEIKKTEDRRKGGFKIRDFGLRTMVCRAWKKLGNGQYPGIRKVRFLFIYLEITNPK